nr:MAG TPA: hypothetical protein [Inoviridae sp.]
MHLFYLINLLFLIRLFFSIQLFHYLLWENSSKADLMIATFSGKREKN